METHALFLPGYKEPISVIIERKDMNTCRLKVFPDKTVKISVPKSTPVDWIATHLDNKSQWVLEKLTLFEQTKGYAATTEIQDGLSIRFLGEDLIFSVSESSKPKVVKDGRILFIYAADSSNQKGMLNQFERWWRRETLNLLNMQVDNLYPIIQRYSKPRPKVMLRKMKTLWGSCSAERAIITFNQYITKAKPALIEYVVLHELVHFLYPNHSKLFYDFLGSHMPDWKARKRMLDLDVVHGL